jgi:CRP-like cAMP-binding protein
MADDRLAGLELFLHRLQLRAQLSADEQDAIRSLPGRVESVRAGHTVILPGEHTDDACLVVRGLMARFDVLLDGRRQIVALYLPGDMCDLHSVPVPTSGWGLEALAETTLLFVPHNSLRALIRDALLALAFWRDTTLDGSIIAKWAANMGRKQAAPRIAHLFCELGVRMELAGLGTKTDYALPITQAQLADTVGMTSVHLNRSVKALAERGVTFARKRVTIDSWRETAELAEFDPAYLLLPEGKEPRV